MACDTAFINVQYVKHGIQKLAGKYENINLLRSSKPLKKEDPTNLVNFP